MSSTGPDRDKSSTTSTDKSENPFITFKRFADAQVSSVLQGIIGLPNAFSKNADDPRSRWGDLDDDLKRRDELKARQQALKDSESRRIQAEHESVSIPVKKTQDSATSNRAMDDEGENHDIDLCSPVTKSLFENFSKNDSTDWSKPTSISSGFAWDVLGKCWPGNIYRLREDQVSSTALGMIQAMTYNTLNRTAERPECRWFHSDHSVLPYILFSQYSPLALSMGPDAVPPPKSSQYDGGKLDELQWCNAFEDLLLASEGREMKPIFNQSHPRSTSKRSSSLARLPFSEKEMAINGMTWINGLQTRGLLEPSRFGSPSHTEIGLLPLLGFAEIRRNSDNLSSSASNSPETEQDMYDRFLLSASSSSDPENRDDLVRSPFADIVSLVGGVEKVFFEQLEDDMESFDRFLDEISARRGRIEEDKSSREIPGKRPTARQTFDFEAFLRGHPPAQRSEGTQTDVSPDTSSTDIDRRDLTKNVDVHASPVDTGREAQSSQPRTFGTQSPDWEASAKRNDRVISTITTTEHETSEDGSTYTTVSVTKHFADGRSTTTEKRYVEERPVRDVEEKAWYPDQEDDRWKKNGIPEKEKTDETDETGNGKGKGKGWFWN